MSGRHLKRTLRVSLYFFALLTTGCPLSCPEELLFPGAGLVTGRVVDGNGNGVAGITVSAGYSDNAALGSFREGVTNSDGIYRIENVDAGPERYVSVDQSSEFTATYWGDPLSHSVEVADAQTTRVPDIVVHRWSTVRGLVKLASSGAPVSGALVTCNCEPSSQTTGADGAYSIKVKARVVNIEARTSDLVLASGREREDIALAEGESRTFDLVLTGFGSVRLRVISVEGSLDGAHWVRGLPTLTGSAALNAASNPPFEELLSNVRPGAYTLSLEPWPNWEVVPGETVQRSVQVQGSATALVEWRVRPLVTTGILRARVLTETGAPVADALVTYSSGLERRTDAQGRYDFYLQPGLQTVTLTVPNGYELASGETAVRTATVVLRETVSVDWRIRPVATATTGTVIAHVRVGGVPLSGVTVRLGATELVTNGSGDATFSNVPVGQHDVQMVAPDGLGSDDPSTKTVTVTGGGTVEVSWNLSEEDDGYTPPGGGYNPNGSMSPPIPPPPTTERGASPAIPLKALPTPTPTRPRVPER